MVRKSIATEAGSGTASAGVALTLALALAAALGFWLAPQPADAQSRCRNAVIPLLSVLDRETMLRVKDGTIFIKEDCTASLAFTVAMEPGRNEKQKFEFSEAEKVGIYVSLTDFNKNPFVAPFEVGRVPAISCASFQEFTFNLDAGRFDRSTVVKIAGGAFSLKKPEIMQPSPCS